MQVLYGIRCGCTKLRRRISCGSTSSKRASPSMMVSCPKHAPGRATPRYGWPAACWWPPQRPLAHGFYVVRPLILPGAVLASIPAAMARGISAGVAPRVGRWSSLPICIAGDAVPMVAAIGVADQMLVPILNPAPSPSFSAPIRLRRSRPRDRSESERTPNIRHMTRIRRWGMPRKSESPIWSGSGS